MSDLDRKDDEIGIANLTQHAMVAYAVAPLSGQARRESFAASARIVAPVDVLVQPCHDDTTNAGVEFAELIVGALRIQETPHSEVLRCDLVGGEGGGVAVELTLGAFPRDKVQLILDA